MSNEIDPRKMSDRNLAIYLRDYGKCRAGEIRSLTLAAADRIAKLSMDVREEKESRGNLRASVRQAVDKLQTYKTHEGGEKLVELDEVIKILEEET